MADNDTLELDETLEKVVFYSLNKMRESIEALAEMDDVTPETDPTIPFTVVVEGDQIIEETCPGIDQDAWRAEAKASVKSSSVFTKYYTFCYDGVLETDGDPVDSIIVECAQRDMEQAYVIGLPYRADENGLTFNEQPVYLGPTETFYDRAAVEAAERDEAENPAHEENEMREMQGRLAFGRQHGMRL